jgi:glycine reductase complex component B subunit alpha and beta
MRLELASFSINDVVFGEATHLAGGTLSIDRDELTREVMFDGDFEAVDIQIVRPGEDVRIIHVIDSVEPRSRVEGGDFPGIISPYQMVGSGRTNRLAGLCVTAVGEPIPGEPIYWREGIIDMVGPAAKLSRFSSLINVVLSFRPDPRHVDPAAVPMNVFDGTPESVQYNLAIRRAELRAAVYLAAAARDQEPDGSEVYGLPSPGSTDLPPVAYLWQVNTPYLYGERVPAEGVIGDGAHPPTLIHPNEVLDGAFVSGWNTLACQRESTYSLQNNALIQELYREDGKSLEFRGIVIFANGDNVASKERHTDRAVTLATLLGVEGAIINYLGGGNPLIDVMMVCRKLERAGVRTVVSLQEMARDPTEPGIMFSVPEADAIISTGNYEEILEFPRVSTVLGGERVLVTEAPAEGPFSMPISNIPGSTHEFGDWFVRGVAT